MSKISRMYIALFMTAATWLLFFSSAIVFIGPDELSETQKTVAALAFFATWVGYYYLAEDIQR